MHIDRLFIYPIKSLGGIELSQSLVDERGLKFDRRFMLVDENGVFITQRNAPRMALFRTSITEQSIQITYVEDRSNSSILVPLEPEGELLGFVKIWNDECQAIRVSPEFDQFFSDHLGVKCSLVYMPDSVRRAVDKRFANHDEITTFADGFPILLIGTASLKDLNSRLDKNEQVDWERFRPNLVIKTEIPFEEDGWNFFSIDNVVMQRVKPCARCVITTINQQTAVFGKEPLRTLSQYRSINNQVMFGQNILISDVNGPLRVGASVSLIS